MTKPAALITGASRGLGFALAEALSDTHHVIAVARTVGGLEDLDDRIKARGGEATLAPMDITQRDAMAHLCRSIHDRWGGAALWIHTAVHAGPLTPADHVTEKDWSKSVETNMTAMGHLIPFISALIGPEGRAVFFDDPRGGQKFFGLYGSTKAGQMALVRSWAAETATTGPDIRILTPEPFRSATRGRFFPGEDTDSLPSPQDAAATLLPEIL
ncbi:SDR family oxidoreductase [Roseivivax sp. THAF30]|jgi:NAD(P)-dependent dehydrogenase (short-subunit alcohol dehydrogenase family)|uniref:SDR family NAD(P)-dependent oxidoreductase n=1 Tax=Roseivivax sp. THAF30 TaxID=2587852 RepID=UPI0012679972|nr:SDR family oxidoreductase [Roseivivax sp. THAF30]QFT62813.1 3-oxoacyl-[acyl-carrier-protein] reductase FabG [Roseivivax sp. THAF30]